MKISLFIFLFNFKEITIEKFKNSNNFIIVTKKNKNLK